MDQLTWFFIGGMGLASGAGIVLIADEVGDIVFGLLGALCWAMWGYGATNVEIYAEGAASNPVTRSYPSLVFVAIGVVAVYASIAVWGFDGLTRRVLALAGRNDAMEGSM